MVKEKLSNLPHLPGVYIFKDQENKPIYIGKARSLKKRVSSYFKDGRKDWKIDILGSEIYDIKYIVTKNETEALLLEAELIKKYQPKFNVLLKDGQPFIYIMISKDELPQLKLARNKKAKGSYFGPFLYKGQARSVYSFLTEHFQLKLCNKKIESGCLQYHLGKCAGLCKNNFNKNGYLFRLDLAKKILQGKTSQIKSFMDKQIARHNNNLEFEQSKKLHEIKENIEQVISIIKLKFDSEYYYHNIQKNIENKKLPDKRIGKKLERLLKLEKEPITIDCFDISHFQSHAIVGSCIRFSYGIPDKNNFRRFKIKTLTQQNDYAALQEIVSRRYKNPQDIPDLIVIDGGKGQRSSVEKTVPTAHVISLAKKEETVFSSTYKDGLVLDKKSDAAQVLMALRDYAHHFAITYHKKKRVMIKK